MHLYFDNKSCRYILICNDFCIHTRLNRVCFLNIKVLFYHSCIFHVACPAGYFGENCSKPCPLERYGPGCIEKCTCPYCHHVYGCNERNGKIS